MAKAGHTCNARSQCVVRGLDCACVASLTWYVGCYLRVRGYTPLDVEDDGDPIAKKRMYTIGTPKVQTVWKKCAEPQHEHSGHKSRTSRFVKVTAL